LLGRYLGGRRVGLLSALLVAVSQMCVMYSQEVRPYSLLFLLATLTTYFLAVALREGHATAWWGFVVCGLLMLHTHYYAVLPAVALILYTVLMRRSYPIPTRWAVGGIVSAAVFYLPWVAAIAYEQFYRNPMRLTRELPEWFRAHWWEFATVTNRFNN